jgi:aspartyl-tRNA(Asn)/glutamyl-tRNA(Gln) amidotransferase subunit A
MDRRQFLKRAGLTAGASFAPGRAWAEDKGAELSDISIAEAARRIRDRQLTSVALVQALLTRIDIANPGLNAFITVMRESALREAAILDAEAAQGRSRGPLHGIPLAIKDNIDTAGTRTTVASLLFDDRVPATNAFVVEQLRRAGAILIGKTNLHEFAMGGTSATSYFGPVRNPWALDRVAGGSSGGSAAAVISGMALGALGTDTGGSIRIPAAWCGVVGLKPTYGLVSLSGIFPLIYSLDHCGPMTRTVEDAALMLTAMAGYDRHDAASVEHPAEDYLLALEQVAVAGLRIGVPRAPFFDKLDEDIAAAVETAIQVLRPLVKSVSNVTLPETGNLDWTAIRAAEVEAVHQDLFLRHPDSYSLQTRRVLEGTQKELNDPAQSSAEKLADLVRANWQLTGLRKSIDEAFTDMDLVVLPTMRISPRTIEEELRREETPTPMEPENTSNSLAFNLYGIPALTVPCGFSRQNLPIGLMIAGPRFSEAKVLALGRAYEHATNWHLRRPPAALQTLREHSKPEQQ